MLCSPRPPCRWVLGRDAAVVEIDLRRVAGMLAQLVFQARHHIARGVGGHQEGAHALLPAPLSVTAMTMATWPFLPLVMNCLTPLMT